MNLWQVLIQPNDCHSADNTETPLKFPRALCPHVTSRTSSMPCSNPNNIFTKFSKNNGSIAMANMNDPNTLLNNQDARSPARLMVVPNFHRYPSDLYRFLASVCWQPVQPRFGSYVSEASSLNNLLLRRWMSVHESLLSLGIVFSGSIQMPSSSLLSSLLLGILCLETPGVEVPGWKRIVLYLLQAIKNISKSITSHRLGQGKVWPQDDPNRRLLLNSTATMTTPSDLSIALLVLRSKLKDILTIRKIEYLSYVLLITLLGVTSVLVVSLFTAELVLAACWLMVL